jgi:hypothetical protein
MRGVKPVSTRSTLSVLKSRSRRMVTDAPTGAERPGSLAWLNVHGPRVVADRKCGPAREIGQLGDARFAA